MTPLEFAKDYIFVWEDGHSTDPKHTHSMDKGDPGNWSTGTVGEGKLIGSNHGVTPITLASHRKVPVNSITVDVMHALTLTEAAQIALEKYYVLPNLDSLPWDPVVASVMDFGWGAGPVTAVKRFQRLIGVVEDGNIGPATVAKYISFKAKYGLEYFARAWASERLGYYQCLNQTKYGKYMNGWTNRTKYYLPGTPWWNKFNA